MWSMGVIAYVILYAEMPWDSDSFSKKNGHIKVNFPKKIPVSKEAKDFINGLLSYNKNSRLNVDQALSHAWFGNGNADDQQSSANNKRGRSAAGSKASPSKKKRVEESRDTTMN